jgi:UTP--glucose-1-phosphate uridylyltransferase
VGEQPFVVALGDSIIGMHAQSDEVRRMKQCFVEKEASAVIAFEMVPRQDVPNYGIAAPKSETPIFELADVIEKPSVEEAPSNLAIAARYVFSPAIFDALEQTGFGAGDEIQLTDAIRRLIREEHKVYGLRLRENEKRYDIGNFGAYFRAFVEFCLADERYGTDLRLHLEELLDVDRT